MTEMKGKDYRGQFRVQSSQFVVQSSQLEASASFLNGSMKSEDPALGGVSEINSVPVLRACFFSEINSVPVLRACFSLGSTYSRLWLDVPLIFTRGVLMSTVRRRSEAN